MIHYVWRNTFRSVSVDGWMTTIPYKPLLVWDFLTLAKILRAIGSSETLHQITQLVRCVPCAITPFVQWLVTLGIRDWSIDQIFSERNCDPFIKPFHGWIHSMQGWFPSWKRASVHWLIVMSCLWRIMWLQAIAAKEIVVGKVFGNQQVSFCKLVSLNESLDDLKLSHHEFLRKVGFLYPS